MSWCLNLGLQDMYLLIVVCRQLQYMHLRLESGIQDGNMAITDVEVQLQPFRSQCVGARVQTKSFGIMGCKNMTSVKCYNATPTYNLWSSENCWWTVGSWHPLHQDVPISHPVRCEDMTLDKKMWRFDIQLLRCQNLIPCNVNFDPLALEAEHGLDVYFKFRHNKGWTITH
jgi:hypothetical protein